MSEKPSEPESVERITLDEGPVVLHYPSWLSAESVREFEYWVEGITKRLRRRAQLSQQPECDER